MARKLGARMMVAALLVMMGCTVKKPCRNCAYTTNLVARYDRSKCKDLANGTFQCKSVVFDPQVIDLKRGR